MLPPLHAVRLPPAGGGLCNSAFHLIVALCSLFVAELFTVLLTYILKSQPFQDGRTMCRSVPVSMRGWCRSPPAGGTAGRWRRRRGGWGWATRRSSARRGPGVCSEAAAEPRPATARIDQHSAGTGLARLPRPPPLVMIRWRLARGDTPCDGRAHCRHQPSIS